MKRWFMHQTPTNRLMSRNKGSVTLEAALIFPLIIFVFLFFYMLLLACSIQMTMKSIAATTVNNIAMQIHAVDQVAQLIKQQTNYNVSSAAVNTAQTNKDNVQEQLLHLIPEPFFSIVDQGRTGNWWPTVNLATTVIGQRFFEQMLLQLPESRGIDKERVSLVYLQLPDIINYSDATVKVTLQYEFPFQIPFFNKPFVIREQASQRAWLPDSRSSNYEISEDEMFIQVISITPTPVRPGNKATITVKTKPHTNLDIAILYKSGSSVAKNLEVKQANEQGEITWEWFVSGNTTPGVWQYDINQVGGQAGAKGVFEVKKRE